MDISNKNIWQHACGDTDRDYSQVCLDWDVIVNGPGHAGQYPECIGILQKEGWTPKKLTDIKRFAQYMKDGDLVLLRLGTNVVLGVGIIVGDYEWNENFSDIDGWELQHIRRVRWILKLDEKPKLFKTYSLKFGDTTQELTSKEVKDWLTELTFTEQELNRTICQLPKIDSKEVTNQEIGEYLYEQGVSSNSIETLTKEFDELKRIAKWYQGKPSPSEFETVAYLVVPIFRELGWTPQKMAIEWNNVDLALFDQLPRANENLAVVVEAKKKGNSCLTAKSQAQGYAQGKSHCKRLIVTDGLRYGTFLKIEEEYKLFAYFNLVKLRNNYPIYKCGGVKEALKIMAPEWRE